MDIYGAASPGPPQAPPIDQVALFTILLKTIREAMPASL